eukprot:11473361-Karenia_brevis.AAC.1
MSSAPSFHCLVWKSSSLPATDESCSTIEASIAKLLAESLDEYQQILCSCSTHRRLLQKRFPHARIVRVEPSQGIESPVTVVSCGRHDGRIVFLSSRQRTKVALTRAKNDVYLVCHKCIAQGASMLWRD